MYIVSRSFVAASAIALGVISPVALSQTSPMRSETGIKPDYSAGRLGNKWVYIASTHNVPLDTNKGYQTQPGIPTCDYEAKPGSTPVQQAAEAIAGLIIKAGTSAAGLPAAFGAFAGPLVGPAGRAVDDIDKQSGGSIKGWLEAIGAGHTYAACKPMTIVVPRNSKILSIDGYTDFTTNPQGKFARSPAVNIKCAPSPDAGGLKVQACAFSAWKYAESGPVVQAVLMNWSNDENLIGNLQVAFEPPAAWKSKHPLRHH